jgi:hypothetical protein
MKGGSDVSTEPAERSYPQTIGAFLCIHPSAPPVERVEFTSPADIKQEAALRAVVALRKHRKAIAEDAVASFDAEPALVMMVYRWVRQDAIKRQLGRGATAHPTVVREVSDALPDPGQQAVLAEIEAADELRCLAARGIPGLSRSQATRVLELMRQVQAIKEADAGPIPAVLRQQVARLRRETHLPLDTRLL